MPSAGQPTREAGSELPVLPPAPPGPRAWAAVIAVMNALGSAGILGLMALINADVLARGLFSSPVRGVPEVVGLSIIGIVFLHLPYCVSAGRLTRSEAALLKLWERRPRTAAILEGLFHALGAGVLGLLCYISIPRLVRSRSERDYVGVAGYFTAPTWPVLAMLVIGAAAAAFEFLRLAVAHWREAAAALTPGREEKRG